MAIDQGDARGHWNYFLALDDDLAKLSRYVEFHADNYGCFSLELARVLLAAASEVDVVAKLLCKKLDPQSKAASINAYRRAIVPHCPRLPMFQVVAPRFALSLRPWSEWEQDRSPLWWRAYNDVKHQRDTQFREANLKNTLNAVAGLFVMCLYLYKEAAEAPALIPPPDLLRAGAVHLRGQRVVGVDRYSLD